MEWANEWERTLTGGGQPVTPAGAGQAWAIQRIPPADTMSSATEVDSLNSAAMARNWITVLCGWRLIA